MSDKKAITGNAWVYGDNVDTDVIIPARYLTTSDPTELARHCMEDIDTDFASSVRAGNIIVAGNNFGCGSSREHAPLAIKGTGISCVIAASFARIFFRNAINIGLPILECPAAAAQGKISKGDSLRIDLTSGRIDNLSTGDKFSAMPFSGFLQELLDRGGLVPYVQEKLKERGTV